MNNKSEFEKVKSTVEELENFYKTLPETGDEYIYMCKSVIDYWSEIFVRLPGDIDYNFEEYDKRVMDTANAYCYNDVANQMKDNLIHKMKLCTDYAANKGMGSLEQASTILHHDWKDFVKTYQSERINPGNPKFRESNYKEFNTDYDNLTEKDKDKDRLVVAVITDRILSRADIGYQSKPEYDGRVNNILKK